MAFGHPLAPHRQRQGDGRQQPLGHERHGDADGEEEAVVDGGLPTSSASSEERDADADRDQRRSSARRGRSSRVSGVSRASAPRSSSRAMSASRVERPVAVDDRLGLALDDERAGEELVAVSDGRRARSRR